ncbi:MAG: class I SAM-dependent methyltransferase, partial [Pseudomonadota bacterium]
MSFAADWLALRAPADLRARNPDLATRLSAHFAGRAGLRVTDLGSGTGNNLRATAPLLPPGQHWRLVDNDRALLDLAAPPPGVEVTPVETDLADDPAAALGEADLVTASAFFDLCG